MVSSFDLDGVVYMSDNSIGLRPRWYDVIITGRSLYDEMEYTRKWLYRHAIDAQVYFNPVKFEHKTRESSGKHKARTLNYLLDNGRDIRYHYDDDPIQSDIIEQECPRVKVIRLVHNLVEKENVWHGKEEDRP